MATLNLSYNRLTGSIPPSANGNAITVADPMLGPGLCGGVPDGADIFSATGKRLQGTMPSGACPDQQAEQARKTKDNTIIAASTASGIVLLLGALGVLATWLLRRQPPSSGTVSRNALLKLSGASSSSNLEILFDKGGHPILLGKGGFGEVYKARWHGSLAAVKALTGEDGTGAAAFKHKIAVLQELRHSHVVNYYDSIVGEDGTRFLVIEFMQGDDLRRRIRDDKAVPRKTGWYQDGKVIALGIVRGLVYLHNKRVVWFDCKPSSIQLDHTGLVAKITDFGLAKVLEHTYTFGALHGTPGYMAPELVGNSADHFQPQFKGNEAVDVYGYGLLLWQIVTGESVGGEGERRKPRVPEESPQAILDLYLACIHPNASKRPNAAEVMKVIEAAMLIIPGATEP